MRPKWVCRCKFNQYFSSGVIVSVLSSRDYLRPLDENDVSKVDLQLGQYTSEVETVSSIGGGNLGGLWRLEKRYSNLR